MSVVAAVLLLLGAALTVAAAVGVYRFPGVLSRLHAATKAASVGIAFILLGAGAALGPGPFAFTALVAGFQVLTAPVAAHTLGRAAHPEAEPDGPPAPVSLPLPARVAALVVVWVVLWGDVTPANVLGGFTVATIVTLVTRRDGGGRIRLRPVAALRFTALAAWLLARSTVAVTAASLGPRRLVDPEVRRIPVAPGSASALVATANAVSLTPGTLTLALDPEEPALVVHFLRPDPEAVAAVATLHALAAAALPEMRRGGTP
jgi:multicomponent Na+:H+ antiporter subunit G